MVLFKSKTLYSSSLKYGIYIPLWSYSNITVATITTTNDVFTFHYGPIQMLSQSSCPT